jgi:hypothetical protein
MDFNEIISNFSNGISVVEMNVSEEVLIRTEMIKSGFNRELVTLGDVRFISDLFKGKLILNENIFYRREVGYKEYDEEDYGWRIKDYREYSKWKSKKDKKSEPDLEKIDPKKDHIHYKFDPTNVKDTTDGCWISFSKYSDDYWIIMGQFPPEVKYGFWICDSRFGLEEFRKLNIF